MSYLVTIDGMTGSGKSTAIANVIEALRSKGLRVSAYHDRYGEPAAAKLDAVQHGLALSPLARLYFFLSVRRQVIDAAIIPSLAEDDVTIADRYYSSTIAYQAYGQGLDLQMVTNLALQAAAGAIPDRFFCLNIPVEVALERMHQRGEAHHVFDDEELAFHKRVCEGYAAQAKTTHNYTLVDATQSKEAVAAEIVTGILADLKKRGIDGI